MRYLTEKHLHDLKGPLTVIKGFLRSIEGWQMDEKHREFFLAAIKSVERIKGIIDESGGGEEDSGHGR